MNHRPRSQRRALTVAAAITLLVAPGRARAQAPRLGAGRVAAQVSTGTLGGAVGFIAGGVLTRSLVRHRGASEEDASRRAFAGAVVGAMLLTPVGPAAIGHHQGAGSYAAAQGGAIAGALASTLLVLGGRRGVLDCGVCAPFRVATGLAVALLPSIGATLAYDASRRR